MATTAERSEKLKASIEAQAKKLAQLKKQKAKIDSQGKVTEKKKNTRRLILLGAFIDSQLAKNGISPALLTYENKRFNDFLTRPEERALFDLPPLLMPSD